MLHKYKPQLCTLVGNGIQSISEIILVILKEEYYR